MRTRWGIAFASLTAGGAHTCGATPEGAAHCWGMNLFGQLGDGTLTNRLTPVQVSGLGDVSSVAALRGRTDLLMHLDYEG